MKSLMKPLLLVVFFIIGLIWISNIMPQGTNQTEEYLPVSVVQIIDSGEVTVLEQKQPYQRLKVRVMQGDKQDNEFLVDYGTDQTLRPDQLLAVNDQVVLQSEVGEGGTQEVRIIDRYRLPGLRIFTILFVVLVILIAGRQGIGSLIGLLVSAIVILQFIVPQILNGANPVTISIIGAIGMLVATMFLAHGFKWQTGVSLVATAITLLIAGCISYVAVSVLMLAGTGSEEAYLLQVGQLPDLNLRGLLLGGMILGILGILDDVTTSQVAAIYALYKENKHLSVKDLVWRGFSLGREHIASLVNTLVLAYAGVSFPLFIFFVLNPQNQPAWVIFNSEFIAEEVVRTLSGSFGLVLGVPISTLLSALAAKYIKSN